MMAGTLYGLGVGPGDPELITLKALRHLQAAEVVAYATGGRTKGYAFSTVAPHLRPDQELLEIVYPVTAGPEADAPDYESRMQAFYDATAEGIAHHLDAGRDVALICQGDPLFYGSYIYWHLRLCERYETVIVPGISSMMAGPAALARPLCHLKDVVMVVPATLSEEKIANRLREADAAVIMKLGRTLPKVRRALAAIGRLEDAYLVEHATLGDQRVLPLADDACEGAGYFSIAVLASRIER